MCSKCTYPVLRLGLCQLGQGATGKLYSVWLLGCVSGPCGGPVKLPPLFIITLLTLQISISSFKQNGGQGHRLSIRGGVLSIKLGEEGWTVLLPITYSTRQNPVYVPLGSLDHELCRALPCQRREVSNPARSKVVLAGPCLQNQ